MEGLPSATRVKEGQPTQLGIRTSSLHPWNQEPQHGKKGLWGDDNDTMEGVKVVSGGMYICTYVCL